MGRPRKSIDEMVSELAEARPDIEYVSDFTMSSQPARFRCKNCGYEWKTKLALLLHGKACPECRRTRRVVGKQMKVILPDSLSHTVRPVSSPSHANSYIAEISDINPGFEFTGNPQRWADDVTATCCKCHTQMIYFASFFRRPVSCVTCGRKNGTSMMECLILLALRKQVGFDAVLHRDYSAIDMELDIYIPSLKIAVEPGSWYYHKREKCYQRDLTKRAACQAKGIRLITVYESWTGDVVPVSADVWTYDCILAQEPDLVSLKALVNRLLVELNHKPLANDDWTDIIAAAQHMSDSITQDKFVHRVEEANENNQVIGRYINKRTPVEILCRKHDMIFMSLPQLLYRGGSGCSECQKERLRLSHSEFMDRMANLHPDIEILSQYQTEKDPIRCRCRIDGHEWNPSAQALMAGDGGCPVCARRRGVTTIKRDKEDVLNQIRQQIPDVEYVSGYVTVHKKALFRCRKCGLEWETSPHHLFAGSGCPACAQASRVALHTMSQEEFGQRIAELYPGYEVVSDYTGYYEKVTIRCSHGHLHTMQATTFINNRSLGLCPECRRSMKKDDIDEETLRREYIDEQLTIRQICERHNRSHCYVSGRLEKYGIKKRPAHQPSLVDRNDLYRLYIVEKASMPTIAEFFGCSIPTIYKYMQEYGIEKRGHKR